MASNVVPLKLQGTSDISKISTDLKSVATESKNAATNLKQTTTELDKSAKSATTFGQKLKGFGSNFGQLSTNVATLGGTVLNLSRQYSDLGDTQIKVDQKQLKLSKSTEAVKTAQGKLQDLIAKGITSGADYEKAQLDVTQALDQEQLATTLLGEALEDQQRANENFWMGLIPTITSAGSTAMSTLQGLSGGKGFGGLKTILSGFGTKASGLFSGITGGLNTVAEVGPQAGTSLGAVGTGANAAGAGLKAMALSLGAVLAPLYAAAALIHDIPQLAAFQKAKETVESDSATLVERLKARKLQIEQILQPLNWNPSSWGAAITQALDPKEMENLKVELNLIETELREMGVAGEGAAPGVQSAAGATGDLGTNLTPVPPELQKMIDNLNTVGNSAGPAAATGLNTATEAVSNFATMTKTGLGEIKGGSDSATMSINGMTISAQNLVNAMTTGQTNPFGLSLQQVGEMANFGSTEVEILTRAAKTNATAFHSGASAAGAMAKALAGMANSANKAGQAMTYLGYAAGSSVGGRYPASMNKQLRGQGLPFYEYKDKSGKTQRVYGAVAPPLVQKKRMIPSAQHGMHAFLSQDTMIQAHKGERVDIDKPGKGGGGTLKIIIDPPEFARFMRLVVNDNQGVMK